MIQRWEIVSGPNKELLLDAMRLSGIGVRAKFGLAPEGDTKAVIKDVQFSVFSLRKKVDHFRIEGIIFFTGVRGQQFVADYCPIIRTGTLRLETGHRCMICSRENQSSDRFCVQCGAPLC